MKTKVLFPLIMALLGVIIFSCNDKNEVNQPLELKGSLVSNSDCKNNTKSNSLADKMPSNLSCVKYIFDKANNKLTLQHINAGFNCCPEKLSCEITLKQDTIQIQEFEQSANCDCNCLYDLNIEVEGVEAKIYQIKFVEPYVGDQQKLLFEVDLTKDKDGSFCVKRKQYPWGV